MNDKQIEAFLAICETGSMNRAAEKLYISQPALKKRIDTLETELGTVLLHRTNEGCKLTHTGQVFWEGISPLYGQLQALISKTRCAKEKILFRVCTLPDISMETQDALLLSFAGMNPDISIEWVRLPTSQWLDALSDGRADMCSCLYSDEGHLPPIHQDLCFFPSNARIKSVCVLSSRHPLAQKRRISIPDLKGYEVYVGPLLYGNGGFAEIARKKGVKVFSDDNAGNRYQVIDRCEKGDIYIHIGDYADTLRPLAVRPLNSFSCRGGWLWRKESSPLIQRFLAFCGVSL